MAITRGRYVPLVEDRKRELLLSCIDMLCAERRLEVDQFIDQSAPIESAEELFRVFRGLVNTRPVMPADAALLAAQDELLLGLVAERGVFTPADATPSAKDPHILLWRGDITTLATDAIVNAANSRMLGCWVPGHHCIDNAIHTFAGIQLRIECASIMDEQGHEEPTGTAKITSAWNLPSKHVIHTVGPIVDGRLTDKHCAELASSYRSCLDIAAANGLSSIAFCCISTGVFGFPIEEASKIAVGTVRDWLGEKDFDMTVVFNVFSERDEQVYRRLLGI